MLKELDLSVDMFDDMPQSLLTCEIMDEDSQGNRGVRLVGANRHFYEVMRLDREWVDHKRISDIFPKLRMCIFDWEKIVSEIAMTHKNKVIEQYFESFDRFLRLYVFGYDEGIFHMLITDLTGQKTINRLILERDRQLSYFEGELSNGASKDNLTGVYNFQFIMQSLTDNIELFYKDGTSFCVLMIEINKLSELNRRYGYETADRLLKDYAKFLLDRTRKIDITGRYASDKFVVIYNNVDLDIARVLVDKLKVDMKKYFHVPSYIQVSISGAILDYKGGSGEEFVSQLEEKLNKASEIGPNVFL